jgi:hypothetical protein
MPPTPVLFLLPDGRTVDAAPTAPDGATVIDPRSDRPYWRRALTVAALAVVLRLHAARFDGGVRANLSGAYLSDADLSDANLSGANLSGAYLSGADLSGAYLIGADLSGADLSGAYLIGADLSDADLSDAYLSGADLSGAYLRGASGLATEAEEAVTWAAVCQAIVAEPERLAMGDWHGPGWDPTEPGACGTTHCLAGWAQALSTDPKIRGLSAELAGSILMPRHAHLFFHTTEEVMDLAREECARATADTTTEGA